MRKHIKALVPFLLCLSLFVVLFVSSASAAGTAPESGSITVDIHLADKTPVPGGSLTAYLVATAKENNYYYVPPFGTEMVDADAINKAEPGAPELAKSLADKIGSASGKTVPVDGTGRAVFSDLPLGLYLIVQDTPAPGYEAVRSFLVTVPMFVDGEPDYSVYANPKPSTAVKDAVIELSVEKFVLNLGGTPDPNEKFAFRLTPKDKDTPMPVNAAAAVNEETGAMLVVRRGAGTVSFGTLVFTLDDVGKTYQYVVDEIPGTNSHYTYDTRKFLVTISVTMEDGVIKATVRYVCSDNTVAARMSFINRFKNRIPIPIPSRPHFLPQTGHRTWLVSVLAGLGLGLFLLGWRMRRKGEGNS